MAWEPLSDVIKRTVEKRKRDQGYITAEQINEIIDATFLQLQDMPLFEHEFEGTNNETLADWLVKIKLRLKSVIVTTVDPDSIIDEQEDYDRWIESRNPKIDWNYFDRYIQYLRKLDRPNDVIQNTEKSTLAIIERLGDPRKEIDQLQKGLVLGSVQSGKTANFNGVINRAIDSGYNMIIVFSGIMEDLRYQTQRRINSDVIGLGEIGNQINQDIGVGRVHRFGPDGKYQITSITTTSADFKKSMVDNNFDFTNQRILVCKKNVSVLTNLIYWLKSSMPEGTDKLAKSLLVIDDEADNASLNNLGHKGAEYASKVNGHIRALLNLFTRRSYLGYTATPFANILQDQHGSIDDPAWIIKYRYQGQTQEIACTLSDGLFPDKFIYKLATPSSYLGPNRFFSTGRETEEDQKIPLIEIIPDEKDDEFVTFGEDDTKLRRSLTDAIDCFILSIALRDSRSSLLKVLPGYTHHHTMLVHISRLIDDQNGAAEDIAKYVAYISKRISDDTISDPDGIYERLRLQWNKYFAFKVLNIHSFLPQGYNSDGLVARDWNDISQLLPNAIKGVSVKAINSRTGHKLIYPDNEERKYIAVGGNRLSRGFTLEGLTINYFLRDTNLYDALLQMGRWFGYRPGYIDACRLFIDTSTEDKYNFISSALAELEEQIEHMELSKKSPKEFELRIRQHHDILQITRTAILKNANEVRYSFQNCVHQSVHFHIVKDKLEAAWSSFKMMFSAKHFQDDEKGFYVCDGNSNDLFDFLELPNSFKKGSFLKDSVKQYVDLCNERGLFTNWKIAVRRAGRGKQIVENGLDVKLTIRRGPDPNNQVESEYFRELKNEMIFTASNKSMNIMTSGSDEAVGLEDEAIRQAILNFKADKRQNLIDKKGKSEIEADEIVNRTTIPGWIFRQIGIRPQTHGLLLIYLMDLNEVFTGAELKDIARDKGINLDTPLIGYALSFPEIPVEDDPGAIYLANEVAEMETGVDVNDDNEVPEDFNNDVNDIN